MMNNVVLTTCDLLQTNEILDIDQFKNKVWRAKINYDSYPYAVILE